MITIIIITIIIVIIKCRSRCRTLTATKTELSVTYNGPKPATMTKNSTSDTAWVLHAPLKRLIHHLTRGIYIYIYIYKLAIKTQKNNICLAKRSNQVNKNKTK